MGIKAVGATWLAAMQARQDRAWMRRAPETQAMLLEELVRKARQTKFGVAHNFGSIKNYADFVRNVPIRDYEQARPWFDAVASGDASVLWPGKPIYLAKTSGTTSGVKYIPITRESISNHIDGARNALLSYVHTSGNARFLDGKLIFLSGSPVLDTKAGINTGRLSGIVNHHVPAYLRGNQMPTYATNCIEDWETKLDAIVRETLPVDMRLISGIPPWMLMYFERLMAAKGKPVAEIFPNLSVLVYGGVNYSPYKPLIDAALGKPIDSIELFPASEGFFAYQNERDDDGLLLLANAGIFYEFVPIEDLGKQNPTRLHLGEVQTGRQYAMVLSSNAGLWGYNLGDTVRFTSTAPYKVRVTGRTKQYLSAFGEHVIAEEVEGAIAQAANRTGAVVAEFTVAPQVVPLSGLPYHEWLVEFTQTPASRVAFAAALDAAMAERNIYYQDLIAGNILRQAVVTQVRPGGFADYLRSEGRLGGQNKVPRLANDRKVADALTNFAA